MYTWWSIYIKGVDGLNNKGVLVILNLIVLTMIVFAIYGFSQIYQKQKEQMTQNTSRQPVSDQYSYLTTGSLSSLPALPETTRIVPTGEVKTFNLEAKEVEWEILPGVKTKATTYNGKTPGPVIRVTEGDLVRIVLKNSLKETTSIHFHGMHLPNKEDGVPPFTQKAVEPGQTFTYEFIAGHAGTYMYHPHINSVEQIDAGLYGAFIIDPQDNTGQLKHERDYVMVLAGWNITAGSFDRKALTGDAALGQHAGMGDMAGTSTVGKQTETGSSGSMSMAMNYNFWTINGKAFPATEKIKVQQGELVRIRFINISNAAHPMHLHGTDFRIIAEDSHPLSAPKILNTLDIAPGKTFDIDFRADNPGQWVLHCHELHHTENDGVEPGGLMTLVEFEGLEKNQNTSSPSQVSEPHDM